MMVETHELEDRVRLSGFVSDDVLQSNLRNSHVLCVPSYFEGYGIVYAEALGYGLPVIASNAGGAKEIITNGREGFLIDPGDVEQLKGVIERIVSDRALLHSMSEKAFERFKELPTWEQSMETVHDFLTTLV